MPNSQPRPVRRNAVDIGLFPTQESIRAAYEAMLRERAEVEAIIGPIDDDGHILGLRISNAIAAACYGNRGEFRKRG